MFNRKLKARIADLEATIQRQDHNLELANREHARMRAKIKKAEEKREVEPFRVKRMVGIKFKALFNGQYQQTEFKTGPGPCGKTVTHFTMSWTERWLTIHQHHTDDSQKDFAYRLSDIDGRIQYDYEQVKVYGEEAKRERALQAFMRVAPRIIF